MRDNVYKTFGTMDEKLCTSLMMTNKIDTSVD